MNRQESNIDTRTLRYWLMLLVLILSVFGLIASLADLQLNAGENYLSTATSKRKINIPLRGSRGMITDNDAVILAKDEMIYNVTFYRDASQRDYKEFTKSIVKAIDIIEKNGNELSVKFVIERDSTNNWQFNFGSGVSEAVLEKRESQWRQNNYLTETRFPNANACMEQLKKRFHIDDTMSEDLMLKVMAVYSEMQMNLFNSQAIIIAKDVPYETVIEIETQSMQLPGMEIAVGTKRVYPRGEVGAQIIGYLGAIPSSEMYVELAKKGYAYNDLIGRDGIEASMEDWLTQNSYNRQGYKLVERDSLGKITRILDYQEPKDGNNVKLTIKDSYQQQAERALAENVASCRNEQQKKLLDERWLEENKEDIINRDWQKFPLALAERAAMMVVDMEGRVLAMANYPTYDLNALVALGPESEQILTDPRNLLMNYNIHALGTPGSIYKMVSGLGALLEGELWKDETIDDNGYFMKYTRDITTAPKCWISPHYRYKHQDQTIIQGLQNSCNYFFYELGSRLGEQRLYKYATLLGLTSKTGLDLPGELRSVVGSQNSLYDPNKPLNEASQDTAVPIIVFNSIKTHLKNVGASRNIYYDEERLNKCIKRLMDMAVNTGQDQWLDHMRPILMEELNMTRSMVYTQAIIGDTYNYLNDIKWGGGQNIMTAIGQSITVLTPAAVARYVCSIANGGTTYNLLIIDSVTSPDGDILSQRTPTVLHDIPNAEEYLPLIREGMKGVVDTEGGTAAKYFVNWPYRDQIAAKTGTAEVTSIDLENNAWFVSFAPYEKPEIAVVVFIPAGFSGGEASLASREFIEWYMDQKKLSDTDIAFPYGNSIAP
ncbi:MAG: hypothetical protein GYA87_04945 [Christensenellaceae bacterium]|nr:hypothetical protein [Christensenellaceae bacterium]